MRLKRVLTIIAFVVMGVVAIVPLGLSAIFWIPTAILFSIGMFAIWADRRRRQRLEGRDWNEVRDPTHVSYRWPANAVDDRLHLNEH